MDQPIETSRRHPLRAQTGILNVAATCPATSTLGPGLRAVVWVQGCALRCPGCVAPDWIPIRPARLVHAAELVDELLATPQVSGLTFSGGEPMLQAAGLAILARLARARREINIICFTGYQRAVLENTPPVPGVGDLLEQIDVLIDGPYIQRLNDNRGLRGSSNQRIHHLTNRLSAFDLDSCQRQAEIQIRAGQAMLIGVPPAGMGAAFHSALDLAGQRNFDLLHRPSVQGVIAGGDAQ